MAVTETGTTVDNVSRAGALIDLAVVVAFLADVLLTPALRVTLESRGPQ